MPPNKRRGKPGDPEHHGRVTSRAGAPLPRSSGSQAPFDDRTARNRRAEPLPSPSARYTPPVRSVRSVRFRPRGHKVVGAVVLVAGIAIAVLNDVMLLGASSTLLPGGHSELYLVLGVAVAGFSTWWFGWFDREH